MKRREFLGFAAKGAVGVAAVSVAGCAAPVLPAAQVNQAVAENPSLPTLEWQMATSWPVALDTIFGGAQGFARRVSAITNGKFVITPRAAGEVAPGLQVLDVVSQGAVPIGHSASYYYIGKTPAVAFGTTVPFGLTASQQNAWLYDGGGLEILQALYEERFGVIQFPAGNTGTQMGGWFRKEISTVEDLQGLKMRIPGLGGQVMNRLGVTVQQLPGGEIFQALQTGAIDAAEWVGPYDDEILGLNKAATYYYSPAWWEPGSTLELQINLEEWNSLPAEYQEAIKAAAAEANVKMLGSYDARNGAALQRLIDSGTELRTYSDEILAAAQDVTWALYDEFSEQDSDFKSIYEEWRIFRDQVYNWNKFNEFNFAKFAYANPGQ
jgi:TRAP-type mannitol/chloroaromatic compound transport system substrate-binding protein